MNLKLKPIRWIKSFMMGLSAATMCFSPVAWGAPIVPQKQLINQYLKSTGLTTKKMTVGEYWAKVRHVYPKDLRSQLDQWVALNRHEVMPKVEASTFKGPDGKEHVRVNLRKDGQVVTLTYSENDAKFLRVNGVNFSKKDIANYKGMAKKMAVADPMIKKSLKTGKQAALGRNFVLSHREFKKLTAHQKAEYLVRLRLAAQSAQRVHQIYYGKNAANSTDDFAGKYRWALELLLGAPAYADLTGKRCLVAGYFSVYGENQRCGGNAKGAADLQRQMQASSASCPSQHVACNPLVYGYQSNGNAYCVSTANRSMINEATKVCGSAEYNHGGNSFKGSPLRSDSKEHEIADKKRIIESYLSKQKGSKVSLDLNEKGEINEAELYANQDLQNYLKDLRAYVDQAMAECSQSPLADIQKSRPDQTSACEELKSRAISLQTFAIQPEPSPISAGKDCDAEIVGSVASEGGQCQCPEGTRPGQGDIPAPPQPTSDKAQASSGSRQMCVPIDTYIGDDEMIADAELPGPKSVAAPENNCGFWCRNKSWLIPAGLFVGAGLAWWLLTRDKDSKASEGSTTYVPPVAPPGAIAPPTTGETPVVDVPPPAPCVSPNVMVGNICTLPEVTPPPVVTPPPTPPSTSEGGTTLDIPGRAGGVR